MKKLIFILALLTFHAAVASDLSSFKKQKANASEFPIDPATGCRYDPNDPFTEIEHMPKGSHFGPTECIDSAVYRSTRRLTTEERKSFSISEDPSIEVLANFRHKDRYWVAIVPLSRIEDAVFQLVPLSKGLTVPFTKNAALFHGALRFRLNADPEMPVILISQKRDPAERETLILNEDIVFAEFGVHGQNHEEAFNKLHGLLGYYAISYSIGSLSQNTDEDLANHVRIRQYLLKMNREVVKNAFSVGAKIGTDYKMSRIYNTGKQSCLNAIFFLLKTALGLPEDNIEKRLWASINPVGRLKSLKLINKDGYSSRIEDLYKDEH